MSYDIRLRFNYQGPVHLFGRISEESQWRVSKKACGGAFFFFWLRPRDPLHLPSCGQSSSTPIFMFIDLQTTATTEIYYTYTTVQLVERTRPNFL
jgi:hypothetical protein